MSVGAVISIFGLYKGAGLGESVAISYVQVAYAFIHVKTCNLVYRLHDVYKFYVYFSPILDAFAKVRKAIMRFAISARPSVCPHGTTQLPLDGY